MLNPRAAAVFAAALGLVALPVCGQGVRPTPTWPINVIRPSDPSQDAAADTSRTVFFTGARPTRDPATDPRPGDELVVWRSRTLVNGIAGSDAQYLQAMAYADHAPQAARTAAQVGAGGWSGGGSAGAVIVTGGVVGGWWPAAGGGRGMRREPQRVADQFPRAWIGGESGVIRSPVLQPTVPVVAAPYRTSARRRP